MKLNLMAEAQEEIVAATCDFQNQLHEEASRICSADGRGMVTREDVEKAVENLIDGPDA